MNEIEKLYENAEIKGEWRDYRVKNGKVYEGRNPKNRNIRLCKPKFTAEKQLELIKWLAEWDYTVRIDFDGTEWGIATENHSGYFQDNLSESLASITNNLWQGLTEQEKQQIKEILQ